MAWVEVGIAVDGAKQVAFGFDSGAVKTEDMSEPLRDAGGVVRRNVMMQFVTEGAYSGFPWARLDEDYARWKEEHWPGRPILVASGDMAASLLNPDAFTVEPHRLVYEPDSDIAIFHQRGTHRKDGEQKMPRRKVVNLTEPDRHEIHRAFLSWLRGIERGGIIGTT